ncbi:MAG: type II secretion system F family protein [Thermodesulfobacteriota bacterium]
MDLMTPALYLSVLLPFGLLIGWQLKKAQLSHQLTIIRLKRRIGLPDSVLNIPAPRGSTIFAKSREQLASYVLQAGIRAEAVSRIIASALVLLLLSWALLLLPLELPPLLQLLALLLPWPLPLFVLVNIIRRRHLLVGQLPDAIESMVRSLAAGNSVDQAMLLISRDFPEPIGGEFATMTKQTQLGVPFAEVLAGFRQRLNVAEVHYLAMTLVIQRETGGQLIRILEQLAALMRRRVVFMGKLKAVTAESRFTAFVIAALPLGYIAYRYFFDRASMTFFLHDPTGSLILKSSLALIFTGMILLKYMMRIKF